MDKCNICNNKDGKLLLDLGVFDFSKKEVDVMLDKKIKICYSCLSIFIKNLTNQIDTHRCEKINNNKMNDIMLNIQNFKDFRRKHDNIFGWNLPIGIPRKEN